MAVRGSSIVAGDGFHRVIRYGPGRQLCESVAQFDR